MKEYANNIVIILQDKVRAAADNNAGLCIGEILNDFCLIVKKIFLGREIIVFRAEQVTLVN